VSGFSRTCVKVVSSFLVRRSRASGEGGSRTFKAVSLCVVLLFPGCQKPTPTAGFWYDDSPFALPAQAAEKLGGLLTDGELNTIKTISRAEVERAFAGFRIHISDDPAAFWRVAVTRSLRGRGPLPNAGESMPLGFLGGSGGVSFDLVALKAIQYAPEGASRRTIIEGIGRGIGRVAAHELAHQIVNASAAHNNADENSYEYPSPDRAAQYYGELHWTTARTLLEHKLR
jgi:hypothetical protein